jgi:type VI secretion system secreted protein Hcp
MAVDMFLKLDGIDGESQDAAHEKWIEVESFSWGVSNAASVIGSGGAGTGKPVPSDFTLVIPLSAASADIFHKVVTGAFTPTATLSARKAGGEQSSDFLKWKMNDVLISSYNTEGTADRPMEQISLRFSRIQLSYAPQDARGALGTPVTAGFDFIKIASF